MRTEIINNSAHFFDGEIRLPDCGDLTTENKRSFLSRLHLVNEVRDNRQVDWVFLVHPRDIVDSLLCLKVAGHDLSSLSNYIPAEREQKIKNLFLYKFLANIRPFLIGNGSIDVEGSDVKGNLAAVLLYGEQMMSGGWRTIAKERIVQSIVLAKEHGAKIVGLGAHTSPATLGGDLLVGKAGSTRRKELEGIGITNGNALTAAMSVEAINQASEILGLSPKDTTVGVVGASGSVGSAASRLLVEDGYNTILNGRALPKLETVFKDISGNINVNLSANLMDMKNCDIILVETSSTQATIGPEHILPGTIIFDGTQPKNISVEMGETMQNNGSVVVDGGFAYIPGYKCGFDLRLPENVSFACLTETMLLAMEGRFDDYSIGQRGDPKKAREMMELAKKHNVTVAPYTFYSRPVDENLIHSVKTENSRRRQQPFYSIVV